MRRAWTIFFAAAACSLAAQAAQDGTPNSSGALIWQVHTRPDDALRTIEAGLGSDDAATRTVAARLITSARLTALAGPLIKAYELERAPMVAAEQIRALLVLGTPETTRAAETNLASADAAVVHEYVRFLARTAPARFLREVPSLIERLRDTPSGDLSAAAALAAGQYAALRSALLQIWMKSAPPRWWSELLDRMPLSGDSSVDMGTLVGALRSSSAEIRETTTWQVVKWVAAGRAIPSEVMAAAAELPQASPDVNWELVARETLARIHHGAKTPDRTTFLIGNAGIENHRERVALYLASTAPTSAERRALRQFADGYVFAPVNAPWLNPEMRMTNMLTLDVPAPGVMASLFRAANCTVIDAPMVGSLHMTYRVDGSVESTAAVPNVLSKACAEALVAAGRVAALPSGSLVVPSARLTTVVPMFKAWVACADAAPENWPAREPVRYARGVTITPPKLKDRVSPSYPERSVREGLQGQVIYESVITAAGCIPSAVVTRSVGATLDLAGLTALLRWNYSPALINGRPSSVRLTATFNFALDYDPTTR